MSPRANDGTVTLPVGNPVVAGTAISADVHNNTVADLASMIEDSLSRSGKGSMAAAMEFADGSDGTPSITFGSDKNSGFYRVGADNIGVTLGGSKKVDFLTTGMSVAGNGYFSGDVQVIGDQTIGGNLTVTGTITNSGGIIASAKSFITIGAAGSATLNGARNVASATWAGTDLSVVFTSAMPDAFFFGSATQYGDAGSVGVTYVTIVSFVGVGQIAFSKRDMAGAASNWLPGDAVQVFITE
jgi:hypothetical protein